MFLAVCYQPFNSLTGAIPVVGSLLCNRLRGEFWLLLLLKTLFHNLFL